METGSRYIPHVSVTVNNIKSRLVVCREHISSESIPRYCTIREKIIAVFFSFLSFPPFAPISLNAHVAASCVRTDYQRDETYGHASFPLSPFYSRHLHEKIEDVVIVRLYGVDARAR